MEAKIRLLTDAEIEEMNRKEKLYAYYGMPYGVFDEMDIPKQVEKDWCLASLLISRGEPIPKDLEERLLKYKEEKVLENMKAK